MAHTVSVPCGALEMKFETGRLAKLAGGSCLVTYGDNMVLAASVDGPPNQKVDFLPLTMDYREKTYSDGMIPGGFFKREGRPTEKETLTMRLMDRPIRPLFPEGLIREIQVQAMTLSSDMEQDCDVLAVNAASCALAVSSLPWNGPIGAVRIGKIGDEWIVNPTLTQRKTTLVDLVVCGTKHAITMVECSAKELPEADVVRALELAHEVIVALCKAQEELVKLAGKPKVAFEGLPENAALWSAFETKYTAAIETAHRTRGNKHQVNAVHKEALKKIVEENTPTTGTPAEIDAAKSLAKRYAERLSRNVFRKLCVSGTRYDGRKPDEIRNIEIEVGVLPRAHGSALFQRGETQALVVATLGTKLDEQLIEGLHEKQYRKFMLHYNFPNFSTGDTKPIRGPSRREIGHGKLGERSLESVLPPHEEFPYTIRIVSEILESNGSSSMATVCGGTLALMDAGVKISQPVAGIAMGLIVEGGKEVILTDIAGKEDSWGDMDFKVAGTQRGITALQMDIKIDGVSSALMSRALEQARAARITLLKHMLGALRRPRAELSKYAPRTERIQIKKDKIGALIGPGGKMIRALQDQFKCTIAVDDEGVVLVFAPSGELIQACKEAIEGITGEVEIGKVFDGKVVSIKEFGAFVELGPGLEGLVHVSELDDGYVANPEDVVQVGDVIKVQVVYVDGAGKVKLSRKAVIRAEKGLPVEAYEPPPRRDRFGGGGRGGRR